MKEPINEPLRQELCEEIWPELDELLDEAAEKTADFRELIEEAEARQQTAEQAKEAAKSPEEYAEAKQAAEQAENEAEFYRVKLQQYNSAPRMSEERYNEILRKIDRLIMKERNDARKACAEAMDSMRQVLDSYKALAEQLDELLELLDAAANILQSKKPNKWRLDAVRYAERTAEKLFIQDDSGRKECDDFYSAIYHIVPRAYRDRDNDKENNNN